MCCVTPAAVSGDCREVLKDHKDMVTHIGEQTRDDDRFVPGIQR